MIGKKSSDQKNSFEKVTKDVFKDSLLTIAILIQYEISKFGKND